jgi:hypothetical protein
MAAADTHPVRRSANFLRECRFVPTMQRNADARRLSRGRLRTSHIGISACFVGP